MSHGNDDGREIARLCECHDAFRWLCGGVPVNYHTLNDFRITAALAEIPKIQDPRAYEVKKTAGPSVAAWRQQMAGEEGKAIYSQRGSTVETVNADLELFRGLSRMVVRGLKGVRSRVLWSALAYNFLHFAQVWMA